MKLKLVNPLLIGQFNTTYDVSKPLDAAVNFWNDLSTHVTNNIPKMRITFLDEKSKELYHFKIDERINSGSKNVNFTVKEENHKLTNKEKENFLAEVAKEEKAIRDKAEKQSGGAKVKNAPSKNASSKKNYEVSSSSSSSDLSSSSSDSDSSDDEDGDLYDFSKYRRLTQPIIYYGYRPFLYKIRRFYTPTFVVPITPYIRTWIPYPN